VTPLKTLMGFSVHLNVQLKFYNLPFSGSFLAFISGFFLANSFKSCCVLLLISFLINSNSN
ncbi:hypothetical protein CP369_10920, partial [Lactobacillus sp. UMNPBX18]